MGHGEHDHDLNALAEKAKVIAEATGRCEGDVLADLLDDGKANLTAGADAIEKHFLDKATEQAEKFKKLLTTLIPILVLLGAVGAEGIGLLDMTSWGNESMFDEGDGLWGCMDDTALNYNEDATHDGPEDESCEYEGEEEPCVPSWLYEDESHSQGQDIFIVFTFYDDHDCETEIDGHFIIEIYSNGSKSDDAFVNIGYFTDSVDVTYDFTDLDAGTYITEISLHEVSCETGVCEHAEEWTIEQNPTFSIEEEEIEGCTNSTATNYNETATVDDGSCEYPPPRCEIVLYEILMTYNNTSAVVQYDLDCGTDDNDQDGFNVSVQFWNSENDTSLNYTIGYHYIKGYVADIQELCLENLTAGKYDFHWIAIWTDDDGEQGLLEVNWSDIEIAGEAE
jgi:hypothetical protein